MPGTMVIAKATSEAILGVVFICDFHRKSCLRKRLVKGTSFKAESIIQQPVSPV